jgi:predicted transcriptional regulator
LDGFSSTEQIAQRAGVSQRSVQLLVKELVDAGLVVMERRGYPKRVFDYIPSEWRVSNVPERK